MRRALLALAAFALLPACRAPSRDLPMGSPPETPWRELFDGRSLTGFQITDFGGQGPVEVDGGRMRLGFGSPLTGVTWTGDPLPPEYELEVVAARDDGTDFFCGLTFPVGDAHLTLILGGWGGSLCGLSSIDGHDAAHNSTRTLRRFTRERDYTARIRVTDGDVHVTLDGEPLCGVERTGRRLGLRPEVLLSRPLGFAAFATRSSLRHLRWRPLSSPATGR
jgi:hypothetical protein